MTVLWSAVNESVQIMNNLYVPINPMLFVLISRVAAPVYTLV